MSSNGTNRNGAGRVFTFTEDELAVFAAYVRESACAELDARIAKLEDHFGPAPVSKYEGETKWDGAAWFPLTDKKQIEERAKYKPALKQKNYRERLDYDRVRIGLECCRLFRDDFIKANNGDDDLGAKMHADPKVQRFLTAMHDLKMILIF